MAHAVRAAAAPGDAAGSLRLRAVLLFTMALWGINLSAVKLLLQFLPVMPLATLRMVLATAVMALVCWRRLPQLARLDRAQWLRLLGCAALMVYANQSLSIAGLARTSATHGALIAALTPIVGMLVSIAASMERARPLGLLGALLGFAGVAVVVLSQPGAAFSGAAAGDWLVLLSVLAFASGSALSPKVARQLDTLVLATALHGLGALMLLAHTLALDAPVAAPLQAWPWTIWAVLLFSGACANGLGTLVYMRSIQRQGMGRTATALYWVPIFGVGFAAALGAPLLPAHGVGLAGVVAGTWLSTRWAPRRLQA